MRNVWIGTLLVPLMLSLSASEAAQEAEEAELVLGSGDAIYVGPVLDDRAFAQRLSQSDAGSGAIDVYNVWTSFQKPKLKSNLSITGHSYQICQVSHNQLYFVALIFNAAGSIGFRQDHSVKGGPTIFCQNQIPSAGFWVVFCSTSPTNIPTGFRKVTSRFNVTNGGFGSGKETAWFDVFGSC